MYWNTYLQKMSDAEDIMILPQLNDHGDMMFRIKPHKSFIKRNRAIFDAAVLEHFAKNTDSNDSENDSGNKGEEESLNNCSFFFFIPGPNCKDG